MDHPNKYVTLTDRKNLFADEYVTNLIRVRRRKGEEKKGGLVKITYKGNLGEYRRKVFPICNNYIASCRLLFVTFFLRVSHDFLCFFFLLKDRGTYSTL